MNFNALVEAVAVRERPAAFNPLHGLIAVARFFRPSDGWMALVVLALNLLVVIWSVEEANWVPLPNLKWLLMMALAAGILLARLPWWGILTLPLGAALGLLIIVWQITSFQSREVAVTNAEQLWTRLALWWEAAETGSINIDSVPFAFGIMCATWMAGFLAAWLFCRYRNFWGVFVLGGMGLLSNLTYLPPEASRFLLFYLFTGLLLIARVQSVRRRREWDERNVTYDGHLGALSISDTFLLALVVMVIAFYAIPAGGKFGPTNDAYEYMRTPLKSFEADFNRLFAGLPARKPLGYRIWGDVLAFQGEINPTQSQVLWVESQVPMYWKARTYATYTPKGWKSDNTVMRPVGWAPPISSPQPYEGRFEVSYSVTPMYNSNNLFAGTQVVEVDRPVQIETYESPTYSVDFTESLTRNLLPPPVAEAATKLYQAVHQRGPDMKFSSLASLLDSNFHLVGVTRAQGGRIDEAIVADVIPLRPDVLSVRSEKEVKARETYTVTSSVSDTTPAQLRTAGDAYPAWVTQRYLQLPDSLPQRVRDLAATVTADAETPYDKAEAIKEYLTTEYPYTLAVEPPPFDADGVDHFLFEQKKGYSEYFASAMTVMLRSVDIPARMVTGYTTGNKVIDQDIYVVLDSNSHGWLEVYMPNYGWISYEATPGRAIPAAVQPEEEAEASTLFISDETDDEECLEDIGECDPALSNNPDQFNTLGPLTFGARLAGVLLWALIALVCVLAVAGVLALLWRRFMVASEDPRVAFRRMALLATLGAVRPAAYHTPYQYQRRLVEALPEYREQVSVITGHYVSQVYGNKELDADQRLQLMQAWIRLRSALLLRIFRPRTL